MLTFEEDDKITFITCIEIVLMKHGNADYILIQSRLDALYNCEIRDCMDHPEYLQTVLKEVYPDEYESIVDEIILETDSLVNMDKFKANFFQVMKS